MRLYSVDARYDASNHLLSIRAVSDQRWEVQSVHPHAAFEKSEMKSYVEENQLVSKIRARFPKESATTERWLVKQGFDDAEIEDMAYGWLGSFADRTTDAAKLRDALAIREQTGFLAEQYRDGSAAIQAIIDVAYAENILWNANDNVKAWAWPYIATEIRQLNEAFWGAPRF